MAGLWWKLLTSPNEETSSRIIMDKLLEVSGFKKKRKAPLMEDGLDTSVWTKKEPVEQPKSLFSLKSSPKNKTS